MPFPNPLLSNLASITRRRSAKAAFAVAISDADGEGTERSSLDLS